jgi:hypothetical protein
MIVIVFVDFEGADMRSNGEVKCKVTGARNVL